MTLPTLTAAAEAFSGPASSPAITDSRVDWLNGVQKKNSLDPVHEFFMPAARDGVELNWYSHSEKHLRGFHHILNRRAQSSDISL